MDDELMWFVMIICCLAGLSLILPSEPEKKETCDFCKEGSALIAYREMAPGERKVAKYCPICGRKLGE